MMTLRPKNASETTILATLAHTSKLTLGFERNAHCIRKDVDALECLLCPRSKNWEDEENKRSCECYETPLKNFWDTGKV
jgi:hypothetical protein